MNTMVPTDSQARRWPYAALYGLGFAVNFLDTLGVGSFATNAATLKLERLVDDDRIPGTLNVANALPTMLEALLLIALVPVDRTTLGSMVVASCLGAWFGTGIVVRLPRLQMQRAMALALLTTAGLIAWRQLAGAHAAAAARAFPALARTGCPARRRVTWRRLVPAHGRGTPPRGQDVLRGVDVAVVSASALTSMAPRTGGGIFRRQHSADLG